MPDEPGGDRRKHVRQEEDHPEPDRANDPAGDHHRHRQRKRQLDEKREDDDEAVVDERPDESRVAEQVAVVLEPDEFFRRSVAVPVKEAIPAGLHDRQKDEDRKQEKRRRQKDDEDSPAVEGHPPRGLGIGRCGRFGFGVGDCGQKRSLESRVMRLDLAVERRGRELGALTYCWSAASWIAAAAASGVIWPAATATEMSLTTRPTDGPRS